MMRFSVLFVTASTLMLAACGSETSGEFTTDEGETGEYTLDQDSGEASMTVETEDGTVTMRTGSDAPESLPMGFTLISGAQVISNTIINQGGQRGSLTTFRSENTPEQIVEFYRAEAEDAGIAIQIETKMNGGAMIGGEDEASGATFSVTAYPDDEEGMVTSTLTISQEAG